MHPFFSIVIPTKNRPQLLRDSILSVLYQNFNDFELIVSDNFNDRKTKEVVDEFVSDPKLRYFRTDCEMNMIDHWEFATLKATGKYVLLLADRKVLFQNSLKNIYNILIKSPNINVCSFGVKTYDEVNNKMGWNNTIPKTRFFRSIDLIENFLTKNIFNDPDSMDILFPKTLNGLYKNSFALKIRSFTGTYFNNLGVTTPDYSSCFVNLALNPNILFIGKPTILTQGEHLSNGRDFGNGNYKKYLQTLNDKNLFNKVPNNIPFIYNILVNDFLEIKAKFKGNLEKVEIDWQNYYLTNYYEFLIKKHAKLLPQIEINQFYTKWEQSLSNENKSIKFSVEKLKPIVEQIFNKKNNSFKITHLKFHLRDFINFRFSKYKIVPLFMKYRFNNVLDAAGFKNI